MRYEAACVLTFAILGFGLAHCTSEPKRPPEMPEQASGQLQFPTDPNAEVTAGGTASIAAPPPPEAEVRGAEPLPAAEPLRETAPLSDEQIIAVSELLNAAEIDQALLARKAAKDPRLKKFAEMMIAHHDRAKRDQAKLVGKIGLEAKESERSSVLSAEAAGTLATLKNAKPVDFDRLYVASQVKAHRAALETLDKELIANAKNFDLRSLLRNTRQVVASHLEEAEKLEQALGSAAGSTDPKSQR